MSDLIGHLEVAKQSGAIIEDRFDFDAPIKGEGKNGIRRVPREGDGYEVSFEAFMDWMNSFQGRAITVKMEEAHGTLNAY